jgi:hypothetical protein
MKKVFCKYCKYNNECTVFCLHKSNVIKYSDWHDEHGEVFDNYKKEINLNNDCSNYKIKTRYKIINWVLGKRHDR